MKVISDEIKEIILRLEFQVHASNNFDGLDHCKGAFVCEDLEQALKLKKFLKDLINE